MWKIAILGVSAVLCLYFFGCAFDSDRADILSSYLGSSGERQRDARVTRVRSNSKNIQDTSEQCSKSKSCRSVCDDIYLRAKDLDSCYSSSANEVKRAAQVFDILFAPDSLSELTSIDPEDFDLFLDIGHYGFLDLIDPTHKDEDGDRRNNDWEDRYAYDSHSALLVLDWIAIDEDIAKSVLSEDKDGEIMRHLFCEHGQSVAQDVSDDIQSGHRSLFDGDKKDCHDEKTPSVLYGFSDNAFDDVSFLAFSKDNDNAQGLAEKLVRNFCSSTACENIFYCLTLRKQDLPGDGLVVGTRIFNRDSCSSYVSWQ